jgi:polyisoprenoid-binding protein YceI
MNCATACTFLAISGLASASPVTYTIDPNHTHPEFEVDHLGGVSVWRGLFKRTSGTIVLDATAQTGTLDVDIDVASVEFGNDKLNEEAVNSTAPPIFEVQKYPTAHYKGTLGGFVKDMGSKWKSHSTFRLKPSKNCPTSAKFTRYGTIVFQCG